MPLKNGLRECSQKSSFLLTKGRLMPFNLEHLKLNKQVSFLFYFDVD